MRKINGGVLKHSVRFGPKFVHRLVNLLTQLGRLVPITLFARCYGGGVVERNGHLHSFSEPFFG